MEQGVYTIAARASSLWSRLSLAKPKLGKALNLGLELRARTSFGVSDGDRTRDVWSHIPVLCH
jgi:hypothetical protein